MTDAVMTGAAASMIPMLATVLLHFIWQGALVGVFAWMLLSALHAARPQARYLVACLALLACVLLPMLTFAKLYLMGDATSADAALALTTTAANAAPTSDTSVLATLSSPSNPAMPWIVLLWAAGAGALSLRMACGLWWVRRLRTSPPCGDAQRWEVCVDRLAYRFGIRRQVTVRLVADGDSPLSIGWWKPMVLLPAAIAARMPASLLEALLAHELAHIRRHDYLVNLLQGVVEALLFYHPVVWWLSHRIRVERELVADDLAAKQLGDPRRLALALSELDRLAIAVASRRSPIPHPELAQAAHGGHLMSRIRQLLRPEHRIVGGALLLPAIGIVALGIAFQAYAKLGPDAQGTRIAHTDAPPPPPPPPAPLAPPSPPAPPAPPAAADGLPPPPPPPVLPRKPAKVSIHYGSNHDGYALVRKRQDGFTMSGDSDDIDEIRAMKHRIDGDFLWFRRDGKAYVLRDAAMLARAEQAWEGTRAHEAKMRTLETRMQPHQRAAEALSERIERMQPQFEQTPEMRAAEKALDALARQQEALGEEHEALAAKMERADEGKRRQVSLEMQALATRHQALAVQMERQSRVLETQHQRMEGNHRKMEAIAREMEAASKPMEAIGKEMEALGEQLEKQATLADRQLRKLIDEAVQQGLAQPAPTLR